MSRTAAVLEAACFLEEKDYKRRSDLSSSILGSKFYLDPESSLQRMNIDPDNYLDEPPDPLY